MKIGSWDIYIGFLYSRLPADWKDLELDEVFKRGRPALHTIGVHLWHDSTDEALMLELNLSRKYGAQVSYRHLPAFWIAMACNCDECKRLRRKRKLKTMRNN